MAGTAALLALLAQLREGYLRELPDQLDEMEALTLRLVSADDTEAFETLFRVAHSMKGTAGTHGLALLTTICHNLEDHLYHYKQHGRKKGSAHDPEAWLGYIDLLRRTHQHILAGSEDAAAVDEALRRMATTAAARQYRGLLVAESDLDVAVIQNAFSGHPVAFAVVRDGLDAIGRLLGERFDFIVTTHQLPKLNGPSILAAICNSPGLNRETPYVMISSSDPASLIRKSEPNYVVQKNSGLAKTLEKTAAQLITDLAAT